MSNVRDGRPPAGPGSPMREDPRRYRIVPIGSGLEPGGNHQLIIAATTTGDTTEEPPMNVTRRTNNVAEAVRDLVKSWQQSAGTAHPPKVRRAGRGSSPLDLYRVPVTTPQENART